MIPLGDEYPKAVYRDGGEELLWGMKIQTGYVRSAGEEKEALADGWRLHPTIGRMPQLDHDGNGLPGGSVDVLDQKDTEDLRAMAKSRGLNLHHKTGRDKLIAALREADNGAA